MLKSKSSLKNLSNRGKEYCTSYKILQPRALELCSFYFQRAATDKYITSFIVEVFKLRAAMIRCNRNCAVKYDNVLLSSL